jgi:hypothetical protein
LQSDPVRPKAPTKENRQKLLVDLTRYKSQRVKSKNPFAYNNMFRGSKDEVVDEISKLALVRIATVNYCRAFARRPLYLRWKALQSVS